MADALASGMNVFAGTWLEASGPAQVELVVIEWLRRACGLPGGSGGLFVSGGSMANITALAVARARMLASRADRDAAVVYCSDQTHSSVARGLALLGFAEEQLCTLPSDDDYRLDPGALVRVVEADRRAGRLPFLVVANAGTTNSGAVDPLPELAAVCGGEGLWLHVDGAYGAAAALSPRGRQQLEGLGLADSLVLDPHKWLFQPYEIGCVLVRDETWLQETFRILPEYLEDTKGRGEGRLQEVNFCDRGIQLSRGFRALKLWMSIKAFGGDAFASAIDRGVEMAGVVETEVGAMPNWHVVTPAQLGIVTFRHQRPGMDDQRANELNRSLVGALMAGGRAMVSSTVLRGQTVLRMCTINPRLTRRDLKATLGQLDELAAGMD
jgi:glutamate/tyrosine decarboxylase-like PLP-dependent enzyme